MINNVELKIKQIRELKNLSQEYVASKLGVSTRAYSKIETGETQLKIDRLNELSLILDVSPIEILVFDEKNIFKYRKKQRDISRDNECRNIYTDKLILQYEETISSLKDQIQLLKQLLKQQNE
ncbi:helix-turn-helix domain-containing protein [Ornithobacterium rhinotracheale]|uniref:helix-turn-helix domain-containing protein n=1 Tax=Ornithobacterium rhinotracheale TaxID=28251 RepID=UPI004035283A